MAAMRFQQVHRKNILALGALSVLHILPLILYFIDQILTKNVQITESLSNGNRSISLTCILSCSSPFVHILICSQFKL